MTPHRLIPRLLLLAAGGLLAQTAGPGDPIAPIEPTFLPAYSAKCAGAQSSITLMPCFLQSSMIAAMSAGRPNRCTTIKALVRGTPAEELELKGKQKKLANENFVQKALAAVVWTGQQPYYRFDAVHFQRSLDPDGTPRTAVDYEEVRYFGRHPFRSVPTQDLLLGGFVAFNVVALVNRARGRSEAIASATAPEPVPRSSTRASAASSRSSSSARTLAPGSPSLSSAITASISVRALSWAASSRPSAASCMLCMAVPIVMA